MATDSSEKDTTATNPPTKDVAPSKPDDVAPLKPDEVTPSKPDEVTPSKPDEATPSKLDEDTLSKPDEIVTNLEAVTPKPADGEDSVVMTETTDQPGRSLLPTKAMVDDSHRRTAEIVDRPCCVSNTSSCERTTNSVSTRAAVSYAVEQRPISIGKRMCVTTGWTIFGLLFFYLVMVALSTISQNIVLARLPHHGWARTASRQTASVSTVVFVIFMLSDKSAMFSLTSAVLLATAQFCHFVIVSSDVRAYGDEEILVQMTRTEKTHTLLGVLPLQAMWVLGSIGFIACLIIVNERVYGTALKHRRPQLPLISRVCVGWLIGLYSLYYVDNLIWVLGRESYELGDVLYPLVFLTMLFVGATHRLAANAAEVAERQAVSGAAKKNQ